jgi:hypothetical protein
MKNKNKLEIKYIKIMKEKLILEFMIEIDFPVPFDNEFILLIPKQRDVINKLMSERLITSYAVSVEKGKIWAVILGSSEDDVIDVLMEFPILNFIDYKINKLAFHNNIGFAVPQFSLN